MAWIFPIAASLAVWAQSTGAITGSVEDPSKAVVAAAQIRVVNEATGEAFKIVSDTAGRFEFPRLPVGTYTLAASMPGFKQYAARGIRVDADQTRQAVVVLELGQTTEAVSVSGAVALVETVGGTLRETVDERRISELPLNGRNPLQLQLLVPGVVTNNGAAVNLAQNSPLSVNGARGNESNYMLDGGDNNDPLTNTASIVPNPDALEEFSILTNNFSAEYGRNSGAAVNAITKSGTNEIHGSMYEFVRNDAFDARNFFSLLKPVLKRNQFGASLGGPVLIPRVYKGVNRTFFFLSWESLRESDANTVSGAVTPTALERAGDFSQSKNKPADPTTKTPFPGAAIPASRFNAASLNFLNTLIPLPNAPNGQYIYNAPTFNNSDQGMARLDHLLTDKQHIMLRAFVDRTGSQGNGGLPLLNSSVKFNTQNFVANHTYTIAPNLLNVAQFTYGRVDLYRTPLPVLNGVTYQSLGVTAPSDTPQYPTNWRGGVTGFWNMSQDNLVGINRKTFQATDSFTYIHGAHTLKFGGEYR
ncbi:MAG: carboxypeptidase regulatory-like domain-containing protein, partial [Bryobacteraceae bacterium]